MIAILAESKSDVEALVIIARRLVGGGCKIQRKGYSGASELACKLENQVSNFARRGVTKVVVCRDADTLDVKEVDAIRSSLQSILDKSGFDGRSCIVIPIQEIESWVLSDPSAISKVITSMKLKAIANPESIIDPKEYIIRCSRVSSKPRYAPVLHNVRVAEHLDLDLLYDKCPSFRPLRDFLISK